MPSIYTNDLRLEEIANGEQAGTWGSTTNRNLELIAEAFSFNEEEVFTSDADTTTTVADGTSDPARSIYFKVKTQLSSSVNLSATRALTIAPNSISRVMFIENATTGSQSITIKQGGGSGTTVTIPNGATKLVYMDGSGANANVVDALAKLDLDTDQTVSLTSDGQAINFGANAEIQLTHVHDVGLLLTETGGGAPTLQFRDSALSISSSADGQLDIAADTEVQIDATTVDVNGNLSVSGTITDTTSLTVDNMVLNGNTLTSTGTFIIDSDTDIELDADGADIIFKDDGTAIAHFTNDSNDFIIETKVSNADFKIKGNDDGAGITALTIDMSEAGAATFNNDVTAFSDERLKDNIQTIPDALDKVMQMRGVLFTRIDDDTEKECTGVIAQEIEKIMPQVVREKEYKSVAYGNLVGVLIEAIKELKAEIEELKSGGQE
tara:strand:- start:421 stop:1731 length:1311 start_codon:yes stop_codon:yes gene_type:complete